MVDETAGDLGFALVDKAMSGSGQDKIGSRTNIIGKLVDC